MLLVIATIVPISSQIRLRIPTKSIFILGVSLFIVGLLIDIVTPWFDLLLVGRALQGIGTGIGLPLMYNIILAEVPKEKLGFMMGIGTMITACAVAFGPHAKLTQVTAFGTNYLGSSGMVVAILVGWVVGMLYVFLNKKNIVIKLPDSVPPNVSASLQPSLIAGIILVLMTLIRGAFSYTAFGNIFDCVTKLVQTPLQTFTASPISIIAIYTLANILWFFGIHPNMVYGIVMPIIIANGIVNQNAFKAGQPMPYVTMAMLSVILNSAFGGQGATIGLIISMFRAKSDRYKQMLKLAGVPALFNINEPLVFGMPIMLNPVFFLPMLFEPIINGLVSWGLIDLFHATVNPFIQLPWTMPGVVQAFFSGGIPFFIIAMVVVVLSTLIWFPFFKIADNKAVAEEQKNAKKA